MLMLICALLASPAPNSGAIAQRLQIPVANVEQVEALVFNRQPLGWLVRYKRASGSGSDGAIVPTEGSPMRLGSVTRFDPRGVFELGEPGRLPMVRSLPDRLRATGLRRPTLVLLIHHEKTQTPPPRTRGRMRSRATGVERTTTLFLFSLNPLRRILRVEMEHHAADGYGGHTVGGLTQGVGPEGIQITGTRRDSLPAHRARCRRPEAVPVRYVLKEGRFVQVDRQLPRMGCR